ncbi:uncharacterized protein LOC124369583 [Homalodisca vitripennis]|uniref:uncharacterized protein LOC124369583 n=1 Tax=Homalodisca vitripennis TaxID=197043 RepID=UPI001EECD696|nr:uncharacterized protein LOC124369583 [Homalodisca vitripennis]
MSDKTSVEVLDRTMRDFHNKNSPMGGCTILFLGDFRQILPVVTRGTRADEIKASLKRSNLWPHVNKLEMCIKCENRLFPEILLKIDAPTKIYYLVDTVLDLEEAVHFPTEFLNSLKSSGLPPHKIVLKVGCPVILLRNLNPPKLCNGTRLLYPEPKSKVQHSTQQPFPPPHPNTVKTTPPLQYLST